MNTSQRLLWQISEFHLRNGKACERKLSKQCLQLSGSVVNPRKQKHTSEREERKAKKHVHPNDAGDEGSKKGDDACIHSWLYLFKFMVESREENLNVMMGKLSSRSLDDEKTFIAMFMAALCI
jgi:hypothetical protein